MLCFSKINVIFENTQNQTVMKALFNLQMSALVAFCMLIAEAILPLTAQSPQELITVNGTVKDRNNHRTLEYVNVSVPGTHVGTITNSDGVFTLKIRKTKNPLFIEFSHLGYRTQRVAIKEESEGERTFLLTPNSVVLEEIIVSPVDARKIVALAMQKVGENYNNLPALHTGFYRETAQKRKKYITISEAVTEIYKSPYSKDVSKDRVRIMKGRKLVSPKESDTLAVKLEGGPTLAVSMDLAKNPGVVLDPEFQIYYQYQFVDYVTIDDRTHYVIRFEPRVKLEIPLYNGTLYIERENLTLSRMEFNLDMRDKAQVTQLILRRRPPGLKFRPVNMSYLVTYRQQGGRAYLNYLRTEIKFKCDWKKRLFATNYTIVSEMVMTDRTDNPPAGIPHKEAFRSSQVLSDKVMNFYDEKFWEEYNIIEPTESLEYAVKRLKRAISDK